VVVGCWYPSLFLNLLDDRGDMMLSHTKSENL